MVLATEEGLAKLGKSPSDCIEVLSWGLSSSPLAGVTDYTKLDNTAIAANEAFTSAGIQRKDVGVVEGAEHRPRGQPERALRLGPVVHVGDRDEGDGEAEGDQAAGSAGGASRARGASHA